MFIRYPQTETTPGDWHSPVYKPLDSFCLPHSCWYKHARTHLGYLQARQLDFRHGAGTYVVYMLCCVSYWQGWRVTCDPYLLEFVSEGRLPCSRSCLTGRSRAVGSLTSGLCNAGESALERQQNNDYSCGAKFIQRHVVRAPTPRRVDFCVSCLSRLACEKRCVEAATRPGNILQRLSAMREVRRASVANVIWTAEKLWTCVEMHFST